MDVNYLLDYLVENNTSSEVLSLELDTRKDALKASITLYNFLLQYENSNF